MLAALGRAVYGQDGRRRGHDVDDADDRLLLNRCAPGPRGGEKASARHRGRERVPVRGRALDGMPGEEGHGDAERRDLGEGEIHEDDAPGEDVQP